MTTWYVRPDTSHSGTRDGTSYATAWGGWSEIMWGTASGVRGSTQDTLYVCGSHTYATDISVGTHGGASTAQTATIRGDYVGDPGSITQVGAYFITSNRSYTTWQSLAIQAGSASSCLYLNGAALTGVTFDSVSLTRTGGGSGIALDGSNGYNYTDITIRDCTFSGDFRNGSNSTGAIQWFVSATSEVSTITRLTIDGCVFSDVIAGRSVIHLRSENDTGTATKLVDLVIEDNTFSRCQGICIEVNNGHAIAGNSTGLRIKRNTFTDCTYSPVSNVLGGCITAWGFTTSAALGRALIEGNVATNCVGPGGLADLFYGSYIVRQNIARGLSTETIDANGLLFDYGCANCEAYDNEVYDLVGKTGVTNSGVAIMVLDSTGIKCHGNLASNCRIGIFMGAAGAGQSCEIYGNNFISCTVSGIHLVAAADEANCYAKNNLFTAASGAVVSVTNLGAAWSGENYNAFNGFAAASGHTLGANDITTDPQLSPSYHPKSTSPLLIAGTHLGYTRDADGVQRNNPPTIGAYEYIPERADAGIRGVR